MIEKLQSKLSTLEINHRNRFIFASNRYPISNRNEVSKIQLP